MNRRKEYRDLQSANDTSHGQEDLSQDDLSFIHMVDFMALLSENLPENDCEASSHKIVKGRLIREMEGFFSVRVRQVQMHHIESVGMKEIDSIIDQLLGRKMYSAGAFLMMFVTAAALSKYKGYDFNDNLPDWLAMLLYAYTALRILDIVKKSVQLKKSGDMAASIMENTRTNAEEKVRKLTDLFAENVYCGNLPIDLIAMVLLALNMF